MAGWRERILDRFFGDLITERVENAVKVIDDEYWTQVSGPASTLDQAWHEHRENLDDALEAWRSNPLARRVCALTSDYVIGSGVFLQSSIEWVQNFLDEFWTLNNMSMRVYDWCDELTRSGELFIVLRTDPVSGQSFVRAIPAVRIDKIETDVDDLERELRYHELLQNEVAGRWWPSRYSPHPGPLPTSGEGDDQIMLHYTINKPVGCVRGSSDLEPILSWLRRYRDWLENRVRLNKYKTAFLWDVTVQGRPGRADTLRKKRFKYKTAPEPGSIIVHDDSETWQAVSPKIEAWDAKEDGKAIRLMVAAGAGVPLHFLSEGESATRATAAEMGDPTFRHYYRRQLAFGDLLKDLATLVVRRANARGRGRSYADLKISVKFPDITKSDNESLARSAVMITRALDTMAAHGWIDEETAISMALKFAGEFVDVRTVLERIKASCPRSATAGERATAGEHAHGVEVCG